MMAELDRLLYNHIIREGYSDFLAGKQRDECPYFDDHEIVYGTKSLTGAMLREDWLYGWDLGRCELADEEKEDET